MDCFLLVASCWRESEDGGRGGKEGKRCDGCQISLELAQEDTYDQDEHWKALRKSGKS